MALSTLMGRVRIGLLVADAQRVPAAPVGDRTRRAMPHYQSVGAALEHAWLYSAPWRDRLRDGRLSGDFGPTTHSSALERWEDSIYGGGLWDFAQDPRWFRGGTEAVHVDGGRFVTRATFLDRFAHELPDSVIPVVTLAVRCRNKPPAIARRLGYALDRVVRILETYDRAVAAKDAELAAQEVRT